MHAAIVTGCDAEGFEKILLNRGFREGRL